jgi:hypothetical protein
MSTRRRLRVIVTVGIALALAGFTVAYGAWLLRISAGGQLMDPAHMAAPGHPAMGQPMDHTMMGPSSSRGVLGGYLGLITGLMGLVFIVLIWLLVWLWIWERPGRPERARCPTCGAVVETDWTACAYCGAALAWPGSQATLQS